MSELSISVIWVLKENTEFHDHTRLALLQQIGMDRQKAQLLLCSSGEDCCSSEEIERLRNQLQEKYQVLVIQDQVCEAALLNRCRELVEGEFVVVIESGDVFLDGYLINMWDSMHTGYTESGYELGITIKQCKSEREIDVLSKFNPRTDLAYEKFTSQARLDKKRTAVISEEDEEERPSAEQSNRNKKSAAKKEVLHVDFLKKFSCIPYFLSGTWIHKDYFCSHAFREDLIFEWEKEYLLRAVVAMEKMLYLNSFLYEYERPRENNLVYFAGGYEQGWYYEAIDCFWVPFLEELVERYGSVPPIIQYQVMFALNTRVECNLNNLNKHCVPDEEAEEYLWSWNRLLKYIDDEIIMNARNINFCTKKMFVKQLFLKIKYMDASYELDRYYWNNAIYYGTGNVLGVAQKTQNVNIQFMEYVNGKLVIDGTVSNLFDLEKGRLYINTQKKIYDVTYNARYSHTKLFGFSITKRIPFRAEIPLEKAHRQFIEFRYERGWDDSRVSVTYDSHTSRLSTAFKQGYWMVTDHYMATAQKSMIVIYQVRKLSIIKRELLLWLEMLQSKKPESTRFMGRRMAYFLMRPFWHKRPVWMFIDKIYKAGDSSEYLYRYASAQKDGIDTYYLVDKDCPDYARLKKDGYKPLKRGTFKHRMMFLYADMMVISNSTVFAFNDYTLANSAYMRDLFRFHTVCVQHGMSVQKIAIAQNRLRDNLRLYFCASKYEIENLSHPVYDYNGHDALKLTGVPRYDGLINEDKRQILITPTWRMQAAVPVTKNEGVARSYNPLFKESAYFKVYNELINDERLIEAAKKYNYRILYVLHPIVSPQVDDFDKNEYVDVVPSVGDLSYEKVFRESSLMVSDYSGVQFDFAYMRKPLVYLHHDAIPQHYEEGTFHYDTMAFGEICHNNDELIDVLIEYMKNDCQMKPEYRRRADDFFEFSDHNNCQRIYNVMIKYQKEKIGL